MTRKSSSGRWRISGHQIVLLLLLVTLPVGAVGFFGCSKEKFDELVEKLPEVPTVVEDVAKDVLPESGHVKLTMSPPLEIDSAYIELITVGDGRPSVVQVTTYDVSKGPGAEPSLMLHGTTQATNFSGLANATVKCSLFLQAAVSGPTSRSPAGSTVDITFNAVNSTEGTVSGQIGNAELIASDDSKVSIASGSLLAVMKGGK